ncbi:MAG: DUF4390 domain-containing protein [Acidobacteria bacterium]|nr:DUF4390 domain-containing protein [Acidobacteriota bacterium]
MFPQISTQLMMPARAYYVQNLVRAAGLLSLLVVSAAPAAAQGAETLRVRPLIRDGQVLVTFSLDGGLTDEMKAVVQSGLRTVFTYTVELKLKVPAWVDRTVASVVVSTSVDFDNLTRRHTISQALDGRVEESFIVEDPALVAQMVTRFDRLPLFDTKVLEANREYYVLVKADARPRSTASLWPFSGTASGSAKFTFIK